MGREVRKVPKDWQHPKDYNGRFEPLRDGYSGDLANFVYEVERDGIASALDSWGGGPCSFNYMPDWPESERTHFMMYEDTTEGTPKSPAFETPEELAQWLADSGASSFAHFAATYDEWLTVCNGRRALSGVYTESTGIISGVSALRLGDLP